MGFRVHENAAPLKQKPPRPVVGRKESFRVHENAAPLKLRVEAELSGRAGGFPRS